MAVGKHPVLDWDGRLIPGAIESPLAGSYTAVLAQIRGAGRSTSKSFGPLRGTEPCACAGYVVRLVVISI